MTLYCAVVKYAIDATPTQKRAALREGLCDVAMELVNTGSTLDEVQDALDSALACAEAESEANRRAEQT